MTPDAENRLRPPATGGRWSDLSRRLASTAVLLAIGALLALTTGLWLRVLIAILIGITFWELARMTCGRHPRVRGTFLGRERPRVLGLLAAISLMSAWATGLAWLVLVPVVAGIPGTAAHERLSYTVFGLAILLVGEGLVYLREHLGLGAVLWMMGVVVISDTLGYFAGRLIGGPKFWPRLSPKKTWSGTVAGWIGAAAFGAILAALARGAPQLIWLSPLIAFAGQMGDIAESWLKRRAGRKDSSSLIPGHGGFMDRFDAVSGAVLAVMAMDMAGLVPIAAPG